MGVIAFVLTMSLVVSAAHDLFAARTAFAVSPCAAAQLTFRMTDEGDAGMMKGGKGIVLTNHSTRTCTVQGEPQLVLLDVSKRSLGVESENSSGTYFHRDPGVHIVTLRPNHSAYASYMTQTSSTGTPNDDKRLCRDGVYIALHLSGQAMPLIVRERVSACGNLWGGRPGITVTAFSERPPL